MTWQADKIFLWVVATGMGLWLTVPLLFGRYTVVADRIKEAKADGQPVSMAFRRMGDGCFGMLIKTVIVVAALVIILMVLSFASNILFAPSGSDYEGWRY